MQRAATLLLLAFSVSAFCQVSSTHQKAMNAYVAYANESGTEVSSVISTMFRQYEVLISKYPDRSRYTCPFQLQEYFLASVKSNAKNLPATGASSVVSAFDEFRAAEKKVDETCKSLDTYYKLEDYKKDNYTQARQLITALKPLIIDYRLKHTALMTALREAYQKVGAPPSSYLSADQAMFNIVQEERRFLDSWQLNFNEAVYTGWSADALKNSIALSAANLDNLKQKKVSLKYPASSMWENFKEVYNDYLETKRRALDEHTYEATKSDKHKNDVYLDLINYFNGTLVADYNTFMQFSERDGYYGLSTWKYVPSFDIASKPEHVTIEVKAFEDLPVTPLKVSKQNTTVPKPVFNALTEYIEFINETWRQTRSLQSTLASFNSSASYFKTLESFEKRQPLYIDYSKFQVPYSFHQKVVSASKSLPAAAAKSLNTQADVIMNIMKEMDQLGASLDREVKERRYEKDRLARVYEILEREALLFTIWDDRKEKLYNDVRTLYDSYLPANPGSSWQKSGAALRQVVDLDHDAVFRARAFYNGDSSVRISTEDIENTSRNIISKEYDNMEGIQKLGRYNGNCPYSPYEDVPKTSRQLVEYFVKLEPRKPGSSRYSDPYYNIIYLYNDIVDDYNKFCELSTTVPHLKTVFQPEAFKVLYPDAAKVKKASREHQQGDFPLVAEQEVEKKSSRSETQAAVSTDQSTRHTRDTIYIEKRDTIYIREPNEALRSMEGYATNNMVLLLDVSGSMNQPDKLPLLKESMLRMLDMMREEDKISIIIFAAKPKVLLKSVSFREVDKIKKAVENLTSSGKTDGTAAIKIAYKVADDNYIRGGNNRIILATDGEFAMNTEVEKLIADFSANDIFLSVFNFGKGVGNARSLENLAAIGKGNFASISRENVDLKLIGEAKAKRKK